MRAGRAVGEIASGTGPAGRLPPSGRGVLFVLHTGIDWEDLPQELGFDFGMICRRRLQRLSEAGEPDGR